MFLKEAINSVVNQTYKNWELILVDDGSSDETAKIMQSYSEKFPNIFFCQHKENLGLSAALNTGFAKARGDYYTWISDDNIFKDNALEVMLQKIADVDVVYADYEVIDENNVVIGQEKIGNIKKIIFHYCIGPCFLYRAKCHSQIKGYDVSYRMCEDYDFFLRLYSEGLKFLPIHKSLFFFRKHSRAMSNDQKTLLLNTQRIVINNANRNEKNISRKNLAKIYIDRFVKNYYQWRINFLLKSFLYHPLYFVFRIPAIIKSVLSRLLKAAG